MTNRLMKKWYLGLALISANIGLAVAAPVASIPSKSAAINAAESQIIVSFKQMGVSVDAPFKRLNGFVQWNPKNITASTASIEVATNSLDLGDDDYSAEVCKPEWFDCAKHPIARFTTTKISALDASHLQVNGVLQLKGKSLAMRLPVSIKRTNNALILDGNAVISRQFFAIGDAEWNKLVADSVGIRLHIVQKL